MTIQEIRTPTKRKSIGDAVIDGLLAGIGAGLVMALFLLLAGVLSGDAPADVIGRFDPARSNNLVASLLTHLALSAIYGAIFGLLFQMPVRWRPTLLRFGWLAGLLYGLVLYTIARSAMWAGADSGLVNFPTTILLLAHAIYGLVIGLSIGRKWQ
jgi:hypothetical protein